MPCEKCGKFCGGYVPLCDECNEKGKVMNTEWPLVDKYDDGIRPAGKPDECFYCCQKVGQPHNTNCVIVGKKVKIRMIFEVEVEIPHHWTKEDIEFRYNESSWCADNAIKLLQEQIADEESCLCSCFKDVEYIETTDNTPIRKTNPPNSADTIASSGHDFSTVEPSEAANIVDAWLGSMYPIDKRLLGAIKSLVRVAPSETISQVGTDPLISEVYEYFGDLLTGSPVATQTQICEFIVHCRQRGLIK